MRVRPVLLSAALLGLLFAGVRQSLASPAVSFEQDVRPILKAYCFDCHGGEVVQGGLDLRLARFIRKGGKSGPAVAPRQPAKSLLLHRVRTGAMPPTAKKVPPEQVAILERWIAAGAAARRLEPAMLPTGMDISPEDRAYWFYQPVRKPVPPAFKPADRVRTPIDAFVLKRLREKGLAFAPDADRLTLLRRASLDLTGLPPSPAEIETFEKDMAEGAYERMIDRLLASPYYGERWGRHWLDVAGYADSDGNGSQDTPRPYAYKYRDYVIRALNADKPLDQFILEQLAGDELVPRPWSGLSAGQLDTLAASGFLRTAVQGSGDAESANQVVADTVKIVSSSLLGLTVGCAQCHDHKYDPIPQKDYYRIRAIFEPALNPAQWRGPGQRLLSLYTDADRARAAEVEAEARKLQAAYDEKQARMVAAAFQAELEKFPAEQRDALRAAVKTPVEKRSPEQKLLVANNPKLLLTPGVLYQYNQKAADELKRDMDAINKKRAERPPEDFLSLLDEVPGQVPVTHLFHRGDYRAPKQPVTPGDLIIAAPEGRAVDIPEKDPGLATTGRRLAWARHLMSGTHPLVGRVLANRVWLNHFGRGLVDTPGDFGKLGTRPTHPELLDWLAGYLAEGAGPGPSAADPQSSPGGRRPWSLKSLHRVIMLSTVYRQVSAGGRRERAVDSDGSLCSRFPVRRLDAEALRDRMLEAAGRLDRKQFGPPVPIVEDGLGQISAKEDSPRRSIYLQARRSMPISFLIAFDAPVMSVNCERRATTTSAPQALMLMNSDFVLAQAGHFAARLRREAPGELGRQVGLAWRIAYNRPASSIETAAALAFLRKAAAGSEKAGEAALTNLCQQLLSSNEFLYVD